MMVKRRNPRAEDVQVIGEAFVQTDDSAKLFAGRAEKLKAQLKEMAEALGDRDEDGHCFLMFKEPVASGSKTVTGVKRERRVSRYLDAEKAEAWLKKKKLWSQCTEKVVIEEIREEALWLLVMEGKVSEDDINALYGENVSYALMRVTE